MNNRNSIAVDKGRRRGKGSALVCSCNGPLDFLNEQSRGPRATRPKKQAAEQDSLPENKRDKPITGVNEELYNSPDFPTEYTNARFFIIKSYSEDNVHKSIKYGVWASTANGNKKLDSAFHEAKEREDPYPIFLFFSVILRPFVSFTISLEKTLLLRNLHTHYHTIIVQLSIRTELNFHICPLNLNFLHIIRSSCKNVPLLKNLLGQKTNSPVRR